MSDWGSTIDRYVDGISDRLREVRRHLHAHPELSGEEYQTTRFIAEQLERAGIAYRIPSTQRGIIVDACTDGLSRIAMRGDIDALPLHDEKAVDYRSVHDGIAHACGHDAHTTILLGAVLALQHCEEHLPWHTPWRAIFQPAEETIRGAQEMIEAGAADDIRSIVTLHVDPDRAVGRVGVRYGTLTAACQELDVTIRGTGGHAARPHHTNDSIAIATQFISAIYQFVPRSVDSRDPTVVSFGMIQGGTNANVIPETVRLQATMRTMGGETAQHVKERILAVARGLAEASGANIDVRFDPGADAVVNDARVTAVCEQAAAQVIGERSLERIDLPSMGSEDFSAYLAFAPGCMLRLGIAGGPDSSHVLHSPRFDIDERALTIGTKVLARSAVLLSKA